MAPTAGKKKTTKREAENAETEPEAPGPSRKKAKVALPAKKRAVKAKQNVKTSLEQQQALHPLELDIILENVMSCLDIGPLKNCRLVNKQFNRHANRRLKAMNASVTLKDYKSSVNFAKVFKSHQSKGIGDFPFTSFTIQNRVPESMSKKLKDYGPFIQNLMINIEPKYEARNDEYITKFENLIDNVLLETPNLESLSLSNVCFQSHWQYRRNTLERPGPIPIPRVASLPKLKTLNIISKFPRICSSSEIYHLQELWNSTHRFYQKVQQFYSIAPALTNITLNFSAPASYAVNSSLVFSYIKAAEAFFQALANQAIQLEELKIVAEATIEQKMENLLQAHSLTLRTLHLTLPTIVMEPVEQANWPWNRTMPLVQADENYRNPNFFPMMPELKCLTLIAPHKPPYPIGVISPNTHFPALKSLTISQQLFQKCFPANGLYASVTHLTLIFDGIKIGAPGDVVAFRVFPKMSKLGIEVTNTWSANTTNNIQAIFENAQLYPGNKVTDFYIKSECSGKLNETLTGLDSPGIIYNMLNQLKSDNANLDVPTLCASALKIGKPCLLSFQKLDSLEIIAHAEDKIDDATGFLILKSLNSLQKLSITNSKISPECIEDLKTLHGFCSFYNPV